MGIQMSSIGIQMETQSAAPQVPISVAEDSVSETGAGAGAQLPSALATSGTFAELRVKSWIELAKWSAPLQRSF